MSRRDPAPTKARAEAESTLRDSLDYIAKRRDEVKPIKTPKKEDVVKNGLPALATLAGAGLFGWIAGRTGTTGIGSVGIPAGLAAGIVGQTMSLFGVFGKASPLAANFSNGAMAASLTLWAAGKGTQARESAGGPVGPIVAGLPASLPPSGGVAIGAAPAYPMPYQALPRQMNGMNPFAGPHVPRPLSEAELQAMSRGMP